MQSSVQIQHNGILFSVEYAVELLGVLSILCNDQEAVCDAGAERCNQEYRNQVLRFFHRWKGSEVTQLLERFSDDYNFNYDAPVDLMLQLKHQAPLDLDALCLHRKPIPPGLFQRFLDLVDQFEAESNFKAFYDAHREYYKTVLLHFIADYDTCCPLDFLISYLGILPGNCYHINLMLGITNSNYRVTVGNHIYANLCPNPRSRFAPMPDYSYSPIYWTTLIVHEFAHSFVNPICARYRSQIQNIDPSAYRSILKELMYGTSLETYINETIIRAIECLYVQLHFASCHEEYVQDYEHEGFIKIRQMERLLTDNTGRSLESCFEQILRLF